MTLTAAQITVAANWWADAITTHITSKQRQAFKRCLSVELEVIRGPVTIRVVYKCPCVVLAFALADAGLAWCGLPPHTSMRFVDGAVVVNIGQDPYVTLDTDMTSINELLGADFSFARHYA